LSAASSPVTGPLRIDIFSVLPDLVEGWLDQSLLGKARRNRLLDLRVHDLRAEAADPRRSVDDSPFGGGPGMVLMPGPILGALEAAAPPRPLIFLSPGGRRLDQAGVRRLAGLGAFSLLCGRYEGIDQRVIEAAVDEELSVGDYVLAGGESAAVVVVEAVARLIPGVMGNEASAGEESFSASLLEYPHYTRPAEFRGVGVPAVLVSGDHGRVERWRLAQSLAATLGRRPDLIAARGGLDAAEMRLLAEHGYPWGSPGRVATDTGAAESPEEHSLS
jgi:tRNA (guanine37-N1)-methyltransferase